MNAENFTDWKWLIGTLRPHQREVLGAIAMNDDAGHHRATLKKLEGLGLIAGRDEVLGGRFPVTIRRYDVPVPVHMAWCEWCTENTTPEELEAAEREMRAK